MKVILQTHVPKLGELGDIVEVKDGYGRNYLIPQGKAVLADERNRRHLKHQEQMAQAKKRKVIAEASALADKINGCSVAIRRQVGEDDKLFGSVSNRDIAEALSAEGIEVNRRRILVTEPIRKLGVYRVPVKVYGDIEAQVQVFVQALSN